MRLAINLGLSYTPNERARYWALIYLDFYLTKLGMVNITTVLILNVLARPLLFHVCSLSHMQ